MFAIVLVFLSSVFAEFSDSVGKKKVEQKIVSFATFGFLNLFFGFLLLLIIGLLRDGFVFSIYSLPTFLLRMILEVLQAHLSVLAIVKSDRSDFGLIRVFTIPLLLVADVMLGYSISTIQVIGMSSIVGGVLFLLSVEHFRTKGLWFLLGSTINAAFTITLFKYNIANFNSVETEQISVILILMIYFYILAKKMFKEDPLYFLTKKIFMVQSTVAGLATAAASYSYLFAPAAIITAGLRALSILAAMISGKYYFGEKRMAVKITSFILIILGLFFLIYN